jgi:hypothetical protein
MLLEAAQRDLPLWKMESLMAEKRIVWCVLGTERTLMMVCCRSKKRMRMAYNKEYLPCSLGLTPCRSCTCWTAMPRTMVAWIAW